jgi:hypothetical protein
MADEKGVLAAGSAYSIRPPFWFTQRNRAALH